MPPEQAASEGGARSDRNIVREKRGRKGIYGDRAENAQARAYPRSLYFASKICDPCFDFFRPKPMEFFSHA